MLLANKKTEAEAQKLRAEALAAEKKGHHEDDKLVIEHQKLELQEDDNETQRTRLRIQNKQVDANIAKNRQS